MTSILYLSDNNLLITAGAQVKRSRGYAWLTEGDVYFDLAEINNAVAHCRLEPQQINSRYWQQCEQITIATNDSGMRHAADLIWRHLTELKEAHSLSDVVLVVPSHYQPANLQLLLGIAKSVGLTVVAVVNKAVLALSSLLNSDGNYLHVDVQLHQTVCSEISLAGGKLKLGQIEVLHEVGLQAMQDALLKAIQERFIQSDRFDPLHYAETEQQLFDQLPSLSDQLSKEGKVNVGVNYLGQQHGTSIDSKQWAAAISDLSHALSNAKVATTPATRYYDFNGFNAVRFSDAGDQMIDQAALAAGNLSTDDLLSELRSQGSDAALIYLTELAATSQAVSSNTVDKGEPKDTAQTVAPAASSVADDVEANAASITQVPETTAVEAFDPNRATATHLLHAGVAVPIARAVIDLANSKLSLRHGQQTNIAALLSERKIFNMSAPDRVGLQLGDRLGSELADGVITVICVSDSATGSTA